MHTYCIATSGLVLTALQIPTHEIKGLKTVLPKGNNPSFFQELDHIQEVVQRYQIGEVNLGGVSVSSMAKQLLLLTP
jgi:hypothetical protein